MSGEIIFDGSPIPHVVRAKVDKELSGNWTVAFRAVLDTAPVLTQDSLLTIEGQPFIINKLGDFREGEQKYIDVTAVHQIFHLEQNILDEPYTYKGNVVEHVETLLQRQEGTNFTVAVDPTMSGTPLEEFLEVGAELDFSVGDDLYRSFRSILWNFLARYRVDGNVIYLMPENHVVPSSISFRYGFNNVSVQRDYDLDNVVKKLVARAWLKGVMFEGNLDPVVTVEYGSGTPARFADFGTLDSMTSLNLIASRYMSTRETPDATYRMRVVDLLRLDPAKRPGGVSSTPIDVGLAVHVEDPGLGIDQDLLVQKYSYSLIEDHEPASLVIGTIRREHTSWIVGEVVTAVTQRDDRRPRLWTTTDPAVEPDPEMGKDGDVFVRPKL